MQNIDRKPDGTPVSENQLTGAMNHIFTEILPRHGYAVREKQIGLAEHILAVIGRRGISLAESEVGTGKTHAYLVAALIAKRGRLNDFWLRGHHKNQSWAESAHMPVVISTSSIALQNAIFTDYIPKLSEILLRNGIIRAPLTAVIRKGKEHYVCEKRLRAYYSVADLRTRGLLEPFVGRRAAFDLTGADGLTPYMKRRICVSDRCSDSCKYFGSCRYLEYIKRANGPKVDFQITNHNYFLADTIRRAGGKRPLLPNCQLVIIDEAHKFLQAARQMYGLELADKELPDLAQEIHGFTAGKSNGGVNIHRLAKKLRVQSEKLFRALNENIPTEAMEDESERFPAVMDGSCGSVGRLRNIAGIADDLSDAITDSKVPALYSERKLNAIWRLNAVSGKVTALRKRSNLIHWLEKRTEGQSKTDALCAIPTDLDERLHEDLWESGIPIILTSGTLSASGDFTRIKQTLGLDRLPKRRLYETSMPSPFDYWSNSMLYVSEKVSFPDYKDKRYIAAAADEIERLAKASCGHAAVLFTSYNAMGQVHAILKRRNLPFPLFRLERGGTSAIERFKQSGNGILLASGALWEGIDIPGDALSMLIIVKLPFAVPDPIGDYERELCGDMETFKERVVIPDMQVKLKQGDGRLIRSEADTGVCAILDIRAGRGAYRSHVLAALPKRRVTSDLSEVREFFLDKKPPEYFLL